ncbi:hypothetical protein FBUS_07609 [Fasciolopsis buskii]|uniref:PDZ domain-containing protein n=1 Tax=Fasciolopsis buskii TaxID=27845 RepID=A0A8E0RN35_9TREM|nr:hypothetical protein FBUS_07609 [Fasciolopsis buski]
MDYTGVLCRPNSVKDNLFASRDSLNLTDSMTLPGDCGTTDYAHIVDATRKDTSRFQPSQNSRGRHSVNGPVERATKSETHLFSATKSTRGRKSHLLNGLRQSARQTLDILCKAWRNSTTNLTEMTKSISTETVGETMTTSTRRRHSDMSLNRLISFESSASMGLPELIDGKFAPPTRACTRTHLTTKLVQLRRTTLQDPFGIFVTKSDLGFRLTRLAENLSVQCPSLRELRVGDELIQVNGVQCARLSLTELSQHFSNCLTLLLTVRSNSEEFPMD